jgi:hypothetical protein
VKICQPHWDRLRAAIETRNLGQFIASSGREAVRRVAGQLENQPESGTFDPLMNANFAIWSNALKFGGLYLMGADEKGQPYCPICESETHNGYPADWWIENAADEQLQAARDLGLISASTQ